MRNGPKYRPKYPIRKYTLGIDGGINFTADIIETLPFPPLDYIEKESKNLLILIQTVLELVGSVSEGDDKQTKIKECEHKIDLIVYKLYGLTKEEIQTIENSCA